MSSGKKNQLHLLSTKIDATPRIPELCCCHRIFSEPTIRLGPRARTVFIGRGLDQKRAEFLSSDRWSEHIRIRARYPAVPVQHNDDFEKLIRKGTETETKRLCLQAGFQDVFGHGLLFSSEFFRITHIFTVFFFTFFGKAFCPPFLFDSLCALGLLRMSPKFRVKLSGSASTSFILRLLHGYRFRARCTSLQQLTEVSEDDGRLGDFVRGMLMSRVVWSLFPMLWRMCVCVCVFSFQRMRR